MSIFDWRSRRVIVVDRDEHFRFWARGVFSHLRTRESFGVRDVDEARAVLATHPLDAALVEWGEDDAPTLAFLRWLRDRHASPAPDLPVLLLVKSVDRARLGAPCALGIHGILRKPVSADAMLRQTAGAIVKPHLIGRSGHLPVGPGGEVAATAQPAAAHSAAAAARRTPPHAPAAHANPSPANPSPARPAASVQPTSGRAGAPVPALARPSAAPASPAPRPGGGKIETSDAPQPSPGKATGGFLPMDEPAETRPRNQSLEVTASPPPPRPGKVEVVGAAPAAKPAAPPGPDVEELLAAHALWVSSGGSGGRRLQFEGGDLSGRLLAGAELTSALLRRADLSGCDLTEARLHGADLRNAEFVGSNLSGANLAVSRLRHARLRGAVLVGANLKGADLAGADLSGANMAEAELKGAILLGADLSAADLSAARGLGRAQLEGVRGDAKTRLPPGLRLPAADGDG